MGGCCCCCAYELTEPNRSAPFLQGDAVAKQSPSSGKHSVSEEREPLSSHHASISAISTGLLVDTYLGNSVPDTYQPPPAPIPYETHVETTSTEPVGGRIYNTGRTIETKVKNVDASNENAKVDALKEVKDERSDELKTSSKPVDSPLEDEDDICPICLEEYDAENPKILTKCDHHFHLACILEWMERSNTCAVCDQEMIISPDVGGVDCV